LINGLAALGIESHHDPRRPGTEAILVIGSTRQLDELLYAKRHHIRIVQRLDGMNWLHKRQHTGWQHYLRSERMNLQLSFIRRWLADEVVYQSIFTRDWWNTVYGTLRKPTCVIHNGVDLNIFTPNGPGNPPEKALRLLVVEGSFKGGHERDLLNAVDAANLLSARLDRQVELMIVGNVPQELRAQVACSHQATVRWMGLVPHEEIPELDRSAHLLFPAEINAACPNSVVEALSSGLPVVSYATGSLPELIGEDGGSVVPYGNNYWRLEAPETDTLVEAAVKVLDKLPQYRQSARKRAETMFSLEEMVAAYKKVLFGEK
jgi:glycosyltransferase involved in cell wall biosynthesis